jgi:hypothetical protein
MPRSATFLLLREEYAREHHLIVTTPQLVDANYCELRDEKRRLGNGGARDSLARGARWRSCFRGLEILIEEVAMRFLIVILRILQLLCFRYDVTVLVGTPCNTTNREVRLTTKTLALSHHLGPTWVRVASVHPPLQYKAGWSIRRNQSCYIREYLYTNYCAQQWSLVECLASVGKVIYKRPTKELVVSSKKFLHYNLRRRSEF